MSHTECTVGFPADSQFVVMGCAGAEMTVEIFPSGKTQWAINAVPCLYKGEPEFSVLLCFFRLCFLVQGQANSFRGQKEQIFKMTIVNCHFDNCTINKAALTMSKHISILKKSLWCSWLRIHVIPDLELRYPEHPALSTSAPGNERILLHCSSALFLSLTCAEQPVFYH